MIRLVEAMMVAATIVVAIALYAVKYDTGQVAAGIADLKGQIRNERETMTILRAEWSLLNQPGRIQQLAERHLELEPVRSSQIRDLGDIPEMASDEAMADLVERSLTALERRAGQHR